MPADRPYKRILLKISGEALADAGEGPISARAIEQLCREIIAVKRLGVQLALVIGAGNLIRGRQLAGNPGIHRATADAMGMLATTINAIAVRDSLQHAGEAATVLTAVDMPRVADLFNRRRGIAELEAGRTLILAGGTGNPFFTTDSGAALRAAELSCDVVFKATKVDGVFDSDPVTNPDAKKFDKLSYGEVLDRQLGVMDLTAVALCMENKIPIVVFELGREGNLAAAVRGEAVGSRVGPEGA